MKNVLFILLIFNSMFLFSKTKKDTILNSLRLRSTEKSMFLKKESNSSKTLVYKFCESWSDEISHLKTNLTRDEVNKLKLDRNATMNLIGFISDLSRNNTKENAMRILDHLVNSDTKYINLVCTYDDISIISVTNYFFKCITEDNDLIEPKFEFSKKEYLTWVNKIVLAGYRN